MRISIDLTALLPQPTGCDVYMTNLVRHLARVDTHNRYDICVNAEDSKSFKGQLPENFTVLPLSLRPRFCRLAFQQGTLPLAALLRNNEIIHSPSFISPLLALGRKQVLTVHDMTFFSLPGLHIPLRRSPAFKALVGHSIRHAHATLVPSIATRDHIQALIKTTNPIHVIPYGVGPEFFPRSPAEITENARRLQLPRNFILAVGTIEPRKNLTRLIDSFLLLVRRQATDAHLVLAGRLGWDYDEVLRRLDNPELRGRVHHHGFISAADLPWYYAAAKICAYPSIQEGFGFPPLEAMASGIPVVSSQSSSLVENLEGAAELVPPDDTMALANALLLLLSNPARHAELRLAGLTRAANFSWDQTARRTVAVFESLRQ